MSDLFSTPLSVKDLSDLLKTMFSHPDFQSVQVYGEIYSIKRGKFTYIDLGENTKNQTSASILRVAFSSFQRIPGLDEIKVGDIILVEGNLSYYAHGSSLTLWGRSVKLLQSQLGKSLLEKQKNLEKLDKLGFLDPKRKRQLPKYCTRIAILTAKDGAAYQDIKKTLHERFPVSTVLYPTMVQGDGAKASLLKNLARAQEDGGYDAILIGRGGGSKTDLSCFDDYDVCYAIATSKIPTITCIGHQIDTSNADRVSDLSAITPTEGASLINPSLQEVKQKLEERKREARRLYEKVLQQKAMELESLKETLERLSPYAKLQKKQEELDQLRKLLSSRYKAVLERKASELTKTKTELKNRYLLQIKRAENHLAEIRVNLERYNPDHIKEKGYALLFKDGALVRSAAELKPGDHIVITYPDGRLQATVEVPYAGKIEEDD